MQPDSYLWNDVPMNQPNFDNLQTLASMYKNVGLYSVTHVNLSVNHDIYIA